MLIDWVIVVAYLIGVTLLGTSSARRVKTSSNFFISDRQSGKLLMTFFSFGTGTNTDQAIGVASKTYTVGASGIWYQWLWLFSTPFYWLLAPLFRRMRAVTTSDYLLIRYGRSVAVLFAIVGMFQLSINIGVVLKATAALIAPVSGGAISPEMAIIGMTILFVIYGVAGGLNAAILTDAVQGVLTIVLSFLILPFALNAVGGLEGLRARASVDNPELFSIVAPSDITVLYVVVLALNGLIGWVATPYSMQMIGAGRTEDDARVGLVAGMFLKRIVTIAWVLTAMCAVGYYAGTTVNPDHVYGLMARDLLPQIAPGLIGLFIASVLAAVMSSCDCLMVAAAALFTENIYKPLIRPGRSERHYVLVGRLTSIIVVLAGLSIAFTLPGVVRGLEVFWMVGAMMGLAIWMSFVWRRATAAAAWASTLGGYAAGLFTSDIAFIGWSFNNHFAGSLPEFMLYEGKLFLPWQMIIYLTVSLVMMVAVSFVTRPPDKKRLDRVYECLRTPVSEDEPEGEPLTLPAGTTPAARSVLIAHPDFEIMRPTAYTVIGFLASCFMVVMLIGSFIWIIN
ncbi:MAG TPA: sodium:solute symporter family protein [Acidobacteriota bacterium]|nr:sodium:solute symporter family protein [Acidobacteriota bacterium]